MDVTAARRSFLCDIGFWADRTALHEAASHGRALQLKQLIESGASVNVVTVDNITPLHEACIQAHPNCARLLLEAGAQVDVRTIHGSTPLCNACASGSLECVKLLLEYGAKVNPSLTALTASPLHEACIQGNVEVVRLMIASGAQLEAYDVHFGPPLHIACAKGHVDCVKELLHAGQQEGCRCQCELSEVPRDSSAPCSTSGNGGHDRAVDGVRSQRVRQRQPGQKACRLHNTCVSRSHLPQVL
ncbi:ankyrin repeat and SOCS box protein 13a.1 isoform X3 [Perca fluviatilis]|uniref:ankyrin repeat and SOCS box protein 13a.1 isoform X3 n=1 Tax=Perca fluviatilis TaxID=8168 RepID=UPI0019648A3A|nr:ankyrin repeat and SOCS box protein 13a.1 isoform X3 [Perca fluviatilis]